MRIAHAGRAIGEKVGIERQNGLGLVEAILRRDGFTKHQARASVDIIAVHRLILVPFGFWEHIEESLELVCQGRRGDGLGEYSQTLSLAQPLCLQVRAQRCEKSPPGTDPTNVDCDL